MVCDRRVSFVPFVSFVSFVSFVPFVPFVFAWPAITTERSPLFSRI